MITIDDNAKVTITGDMKDQAANSGCIILEITKRLDDDDPKMALAYLQTIYGLICELGDRINSREIDKNDERIKKAMERRMKERGMKNGNTEQHDTSSGNAADSSKS